MINNLATTQMIQNIINGTTPPTQAANATNATNATNAESAANATFFGTCSTAASTSAKTVTIDGFTTSNLTNGTRIAVYFTYNNTSSSPTLNVSGTGALNLVTQTGTELTYAVGDWAAGSLVSFVYYNNEWVLQSPTLIATLNGTEYFAGNPEPTWYAPISAGTKGYIPVSNGSGAPSWVNPKTATLSGTTTNGTGGVVSATTSLSNRMYCFIIIRMTDNTGSLYDMYFYFSAAEISYALSSGEKIAYQSFAGSGAFEFTSSTSVTHWFFISAGGSSSFVNMKLYVSDN